MIFKRWEIALWVAFLAGVGGVLYPSEYTRGLMLRREGDRSAAIGYFRDFLSRHPGHKGAALALAQAYEEAGRPDEAVEPLMTLYRGRKGDTETGMRLLQVLDGVGRHEDADGFRWELAEDLTRKPGNHEQLREQLLYPALQAGLARQDDEAVLRILGALMKLPNKGSSYRDEMLRILLERRKLDMAVELLLEISRERPDDFEAIRMIARVHVYRKDTASALAALSEALKKHPRRAPLFEDRAALLSGEKRWLEAASDFEKLAALEPNSKEWPRSRAHALIQGGEFNAGMALYRRSLELRPSDPEAWWDITYALGDNGRPIELAEHLEAYLEVFPDDARAYEALTYAYKDTGRLPEAIAVLARRIKAGPRDAALRREIIYLLQVEERRDEAVTHSIALLALTPLDPQIRHDLADYHERKGERLLAVRYLEAQLKVFTKDEAAMDKLASLYVDLGRRAEAIRLIRASFSPVGGMRAVPR